MEKIKRTGMKCIEWFMIAMVVISAGYALIGELFLPVELEKKTHCEVFQAEWMRVLSDGSKEKIEIPGRCEADRNETVVVETTLPDMLRYGDVLWFWSLRQDMKIYVDDVLREEYSTQNTRFFGKTSSAAFIFVELTDEDEGKTLRVESLTDSDYSGVFRAVYIGDKASILWMLFNQYGPELFISVLILVLSVACITISLVLRLVYHREVALEYLGWGILMAAAWVINNSIFRQLLFKNISVSSDITFFCIMLLPFPFLIYMNKIQKGRYQLGAVIIGVIAAIDTIVCIFLQAFCIKDYVETIAYMGAVCILGIIFIAVTMILDIRKGYIREYGLIATGILGVCIAAVAQIFLYFQKVDIPFTGVVTAVGLIFLLIAAAVSTVREVLLAEQEKREAILASESRARFLASMSHEIRTPINAVLGMDEMILREGTEENILEYARDIQSAGRSLLAIINDILDFSKIESGKLEIIPVEYEISSLINDCYNMIYMRAKEKGLKLQVVNDSSIPKRLKGDEIRIRQIITNLLTNAVKYTREGEIVFRLEGRTEPSGFTLVISVKDTGIGITEEDQGKLFQSFQRIEEEKNRNIEGTGLGLSITKQLVELMDGRISVSSTYGKGSVFTVEIPQTVLSEETVGDISENYKISEKKRGKKAFTAPDARVLVVDDVAVNLKVFMGLLKETKIQIDAVKSGRQCLAMIKQRKYQMIFLDHMMPEMDGIETFHKMQKQSDNQNQNTPVIMLTANAILGAREKYITEGFTDYLAKPFNQEELVRLIAKYLPESMLCWQEPEKGKAKQGLLGHLGFLDTAQGLGYCMNQEERYTEVLNTYLEERCDTRLQELYEKQDWEKYSTLLHGLKNSSLYIGATGFSNEAKEMEDAARLMVIPYIKEHHDTLLKEYRGLLAKIENALNN